MKSSDAETTMRWMPPYRPRDGNRRARQFEPAGDQYRGASGLMANQLPDKGFPAKNANRGLGRS